MSQTRFVNQLTGRAPYRSHDHGARDNIVFVTTDMVPPEFWQDGSYRPVRQTPALDALAGDGVTFSNCFATAPICSPSRAAYLTGRHAYLTGNDERGHDGHAVHLRESDTIFPEYLLANGYHTRHVGKCHVGRNKFLDAFSENDSPWDRWSPPWFDDDAYISYLAGLGLKPITFSREIYGTAASGTGRGNFYGGYIAPQNGEPFPIEGTYPWFLVERAIAALESRRSADQPFYLQLDFFGPHQPFAIPGGFEGRERQIRAQLPEPYGVSDLLENGSRDRRREPRVYQLYRKNWGCRDAETITEYRVANLLQYELIDRAIDHLVNYLRNNRLYDQTTIVYAADHGEMNGNLALIDKGAYLSPQVLRSPLVIKPSVAGRAYFPRESCDTPVSLIDIAPTILSLAGADIFDRLDGVPLQNTVAGRERPQEKPILAETWVHVVPNPAVATVFQARDTQWYLFSFNICDPISELYRVDAVDIEAGRLDNLAIAPGHDEVVHEAVQVMYSRLAADQRWQGYRAYLELVFAEVVRSAGDRQSFV